MENPGEPWAYKEIGLSNIYLGRPEQALDWFVKADRIGPRDPARWTWLDGRGHALILLGRDEEAIHSLTSALDADPKYLTWHGAASQYRARRWCWRQDHEIFFRCQTAPLKYSYMLGGGMFSSCASAMCLRTVSEYKKRSPQMRQCHCSRSKMYGRHSGSFGSSLEWGIFKILQRARAAIHGVT